MKKQMRQQDRRGAMLVLVAFVLVILLIGAVFSVDVAYMHMVRAELRTATDAAARAGSEALARTQDIDVARAAAINAASQNKVAGKGLTLSGNDVLFGGLNVSQNGRFDFSEGQAPTTAVRVSGRRDQASADGAVQLFFARLFSTSQFEPVLDATAAANVRDVALVLDVSGSMAASAGGITRLQGLKLAVNAFIDEIVASSPSTQLSLTSYSTFATKNLELTNDFQLVRTTTNRFIPTGFTAIGNALTVGSDSLVRDPLARTFAAKTIVLMTDGNHNTGPSPITTVSTAIARGQQVHTITFGSDADQNLMRRVSNAAGQGSLHIHADDAADLTEAFREIARSLSVVLVE